VLIVVKGLSRDKSSHVQNSLWVYDINKNKWLVFITVLKMQQCLTIMLMKRLDSAHYSWLKSIVGVPWKQGNT